MNTRLIAIAAAALVAGIPAQGLAFDPSAEYSVHSLAQLQGAGDGGDIRALGVPSQTSGIGERAGMQNPVGFGIDPSAEYSTNLAWQPKGLGN